MDAVGGTSHDLMHAYDGWMEVGKQMYASFEAFSHCVFSAGVEIPQHAPQTTKPHCTAIDVCPRCQARNRFRVNVVGPVRSGEHALSELHKWVPVALEHAST